MEEKEVSRDELFEKEERCARAIRTLIRALLARLLVTAILLWVILAVTRQAAVAALFALVAVLNAAGSVPLLQELKKRLLEQKALRKLEKED